MDLLQVMNRRRNLTGYVEVSDSLSMGRIWIQEGAIIAADWKDRQGELAVESMLRLKQGHFEVGEAATLPVRTILKDTVALLMVSMRAIGRDALTPAASPRVPGPQHDQKISGPVPAMQAGKLDELLPAPAHPIPMDLSRKRGLVIPGRWIWRIAAAVLLLVLAGTGLMIGVKLWVARQSQSAVPKEVVQTPPPLESVAVPAPAKSIASLHDGWPDIMLSALAASGKNHWCAILNGQLLGVGEQVDGVTVRSIRANGVLLEYQGQRRFMCAAKK